MPLKAKALSFRETRSYSGQEPSSVRTKMQLPIPIRRVGRSISTNSPIILSGLAVAGVVATAVLAVRATPKAVEKIKAAEAEKNVWTEAQPVSESEFLSDKYVPVTTVEIVKATW